MGYYTDGSLVAEHPAETLKIRVAMAEQAMQHQRWADAIVLWQDIAATCGEQTPDVVYQRLDEAYRQEPGFPKGTDQEEGRIGDGDKYALLELIHRTLTPDRYLEIGVQKGKSLAIAECDAIGVDPMPNLKESLSSRTKLLTMTSDVFFKGPATSLLKAPPDLVFIDGMHLFEYALRDFINVERFSAAWTLVVVDDIFPVHPVQAERKRRTRTWTGDVWKVYEILQRSRPDLFLLPVNASPTGLLLITGLCPENRILSDSYDAIVREYSVRRSPPSEILERRGVRPTHDTAIGGILDVLKQERYQRTSAADLVARLQKTGRGSNSTSRITRANIRPSAKQKTCVVYTAISGGYDQLSRPEIISEHCCYICFTDNPKITSDVWDVRPLPRITEDRVRLAKIPKLLPHLFLSEFDVSIWLDSNFVIGGDLGLLAEQVLQNHSLAVFRHPENRPSIHDEAKVCMELGKDDADVIIKQIQRYNTAGFPGDCVPACGVIIRRHNDPQVIHTMEDWWLQVCAYSRRDQLSFGYVAWKNNLKFYLIDDSIRDNKFVKLRARRGLQASSTDIGVGASEKLNTASQRQDTQIPYRAWAHPVRQWSNQELARIGSLFRGSVINVSGWEDKDKNGGFYRDYFPQIARYDVSNFSQSHPTCNVDSTFDLDLGETIPEELVSAYDVVFNHTTLEHVFDVFTAFKNLCRMTRDIVIVVVPFIQQQHEVVDYKDYWRFTPSCLRELFSVNGLTTVYESFSNRPNDVNYLLFVGSKHPHRWQGQFPQYDVLHQIGHWVS